MGAVGPCMAYRSSTQSWLHQTVLWEGLCTCPASCCAHQVHSWLASLLPRMGNRRAVKALLCSSSGHYQHGRIPYGAALASAYWHGFAAWCASPAHAACVYLLKICIPAGFENPIPGFKCRRHAVLASCKGRVMMQSIKLDPGSGPVVLGYHGSQQHEWQGPRMHQDLFLLGCMCVVCEGHAEVQLGCSSVQQCKGEGSLSAALLLGAKFCQLLFWRLPAAGVCACFLRSTRIVRRGAEALALCIRTCAALGLVGRPGCACCVPPLLDCACELINSCTGL